MGAPLKLNDVPNILEGYVHFASPKFWNDPACITGIVKYVEASSNPHVIYLEPYGLNYLVRVDIRCYNVAEKIEEHEQHSSH